ncbi:MAG TPA: DUF72 domain-containing protein [Candidatus Eisenbacteria bacterium]|nr:DUF72 domain-containing protein [Candidatus Eisenbacteria bacterium]
MARVHIGTMGWSYNFWVGNFYPKGLKSTDFLTEYSKHFHTVEVDNTFYRVPNKSTLEKWKEQTPPEFLFSAKFPQVITHQKMLRDCEQELQFFIERISALEEKLGPLLLQFPPMFGSKQAVLLDDFLPRLPKKHRCAVEVRNAQLLNPSFFALLRENHVALAIVVSPFMPEINEMTADFAYVRWEGDRKKVNGALGKVEVDKTDETKRWGEKIKGFLKEVDEAFGYFSKYYSGEPTADAEQLIELLT